MPIQEFCKVTVSRKLADGLFETVMEAPALCAKARAGQFVHIACGEGNFLRRPISICDAADNQLRVVYQVKGEGTKWLSERRVGDVLDVLGTLGNGFDMHALGDRPVFIGGGIGVPPMLLSMKKAKANGAHPAAILGFRNEKAVILEDEFRALGEVYTATDDGSYGIHGFVTDVLKAHPGEFTSVCCCGPKGMLKALAAVAEAEGIPCQVSLEERMGCGIGACLVCVCELLDKEGKPRYGHVCKDGPVFDSKEVNW